MSLGRTRLKKERTVISRARGWAHSPENRRRCSIHRPADQPLGRTMMEYSEDLRTTVFLARIGRLLRWPVRFQDRV